MRLQALYPRQAEFRISRPRNVIVVENCGDVVLVRAARDNFSERRKRLFIRHLAAEGFIPGRFEKLSAESVNGVPGLEWIVETAKPVSEAVQRPSPLLRILWIVFLGSLLWLGLMVLAFSHSR